MTENTSTFPFYNCKNYSEGLTSRDFIAIMAMQGYCANPNCLTMSYKDVAIAAYRQADAMLKESENK